MQKSLSENPPQSMMAFGTEKRYNHSIRADPMPFPLVKHRKSVDTREAFSTNKQNEPNSPLDAMQMHIIPPQAEKKKRFSFTRGFLAKKNGGEKVERASQTTILAPMKNASNGGQYRSICK